MSVFFLPSDLQQRQTPSSPTAPIFIYICFSVNTFNLSIFFYWLILTSLGRLLSFTPKLHLSLAVLSIDKSSLLKAEVISHIMTQRDSAAAALWATCCVVCLVDSATGSDSVIWTHN